MKKHLKKLMLAAALSAGDLALRLTAATPKDLAEALAAQGFTIDRRKIQLAQPIKEVGTVTVPIKMPREVTATITVRVVKKQEQETAEA
mgnify:CR=1 FL=1